MSQIILYAKATVDQAMDALASACKKEGFEIDEEKDTRMKIRKGSALTAYFLWWTPFVVSDVRVKEDEEGEVKINIEWTNAWWRWFMAMMQNPGVMRKYADAVERAVEKAGGEVLERKGG